MITPANIFAALILLVSYLAVAFSPGLCAAQVRRLPGWAQILLPAYLCVPYVLVAAGAGIFRWRWLAFYLLLPVAIAALLRQAAAVDPEQRGTWREVLVLTVLGLGVDLRWFEPAWPPHMSIFNKVLLLDAGIYGFVLIRRLEGTGFDLRLRLRDLGIGLREVAFYTPIALALGLSLGFLHLHRAWPGFAAAAEAWLFTFFFIAVPEELFFRGWVQNLLEHSLKRKMAWRKARLAALLVTSCLFGLAHFNKRTVGHMLGNFNWRYVLLAALAGVFYGRAWMRDRRMCASAVTHASVDTIWSLWLR